VAAPHTCACHELCRGTPLLCTQFAAHYALMSSHTFCTADSEWGGVLSSQLARQDMSREPCAGRGLGEGFVHRKVYWW
jgi:hypothetical protein